MSVPRVTACWLDDDGKHIWVRHACKGGEIEYMLPTTWWVIAPDERPAGFTYPAGHVEPSFSCEVCGAHEFLTVGERPHTLDESCWCRPTVETVP